MRCERFVVCASGLQVGNVPGSGGANVSQAGTSFMQRQLYSSAIDAEKRKPNPCGKPGRSLIPALPKYQRSTRAIPMHIRDNSQPALWKTVLQLNLTRST